jgi:LAO/AO transport system kinase
VQAIKAGILEIADIFVVNKADLPLAERTESDLRRMLALTKRTGWIPPVMRTIATTGEGVAGLLDVVAQHAAAAASHTRLSGARGRMRRVLALAAAERLREHLERMESSELDALCSALHRGELNYQDAAAQALVIAGGPHD